MTNEEIPTGPAPERNPEEGPLSPIRRRFVGLQLWTKQIQEWMALQIDKAAVGARITAGGEVGKARESIEDARKAWYRGFNPGVIDQSTDRDLRTRARTEAFERELREHKGDPSLLFQRELEATEDDVNANVEALVADIGEYDVHGRLRTSVFEAKPLVEKLLDSKEDPLARGLFDSMLMKIATLERWLEVTEEASEENPKDSSTPGQPWTFLDMMKSDVPDMPAPLPEEVENDREIPVPLGDTDSATALMRAYWRTVPKMANMAVRARDEVQQLRVLADNKNIALAKEEKRYSIDRIERGIRPPAFNEVRSVMQNTETRKEYAELEKALAGVSKALTDFSRLMDAIASASRAGLDTYVALGEARSRLMDLSKIHEPVRKRRQKIEKIREARHEVATKGTLTNPGVLKKPRKRKKRS